MFSKVAMTASALLIQQCIHALLQWLRFWSRELLGRSIRSSRWISADYWALPGEFALYLV